MRMGNMYVPRIFMLFVQDVKNDDESGSMYLFFTIPLHNFLILLFLSIIQRQQQSLNTFDGFADAFLSRRCACIEKIIFFFCVCVVYKTSPAKFFLRNISRITKKCYVPVFIFA